MTRYGMLTILLVLASFLLAESAQAQTRAGQSTTIQTGTVTEVRSVDLNDGNAVGGALVGGAFGAALTRSNRSNRQRNRNAAIGALIGGSAAASSRRPGRLYTVRTNDGTMVRIATEQTEIRVNDCVYIEQSGGSANIRRAAAVACEPESASVMNDPAIVEELQEDAGVCSAAKQELIDADTDEAIDRAIRKVKLLCYD